MIFCGYLLHDKVLLVLRIPFIFFICITLSMCMSMYLMGCIHIYTKHARMPLTSVYKSRGEVSVFVNIHLPQII